MDANAASNAPRSRNDIINSINDSMAVIFNGMSIGRQDYLGLDRLATELEEMAARIVEARIRRGR